MEATKIAMMKDLRVYVNPEAAEHVSEHRVFYSRRRDGPYYCWRYEERLGHWCGSRILASELSVKELCMTPWKALPTALQASIDAYYVE
ncbi:MAG: hypothetical protein LC731_01940 [Acidobacteria bacterium]|nr:hypothetical protein [Acidobacteriota bacterium]